MTIVAVTTGLALIIHDRITELTVGGGAEQELGTLSNAIDEATATLGDLKSVIEFTKIVVAAQNDDRKAFDKLRQWADDKSNPFSTKAEQAWNTIFSDHTKPFYSSGFTGIWKDGFDPTNLRFGDLAQLYQIAPAQIKPAP